VIFLLVDKTTLLIDKPLGLPARLSVKIGGADLPPEI
jgi:hypothetical protein